MAAPPVVERWRRWAAATERGVDALEARPRTLLAVYALLLAMQISPWWYASKDDCLYLSIARSMVRDDTVRALGSPRLVVGPGYPALLAPAFLMGDRPFLAVSIVQWLISLALIAGVYVWCRRHEPGRAVLLTGLCVLNMTVWYYFRRPLKEIAFLTGLLWTVNLLHPLCEPQPRGRTAALCFLASLLFGYTLFIRLTGVVLVPAFLLVLGWRAWRGDMTWPRAALLAACVATVGCGTVLGQVLHERHLEATLGGADSYATMLAKHVSESSVGSVWRGIRDRYWEVGQTVVPGTFKVASDPEKLFQVEDALFLLVLAAVAVGWLALVRSRVELMALMAPLYAGIYALNGVSQGPRLAAPMAPVLFVSLWFALRSWPRSGPRLVGGLVAAHLFVAFGYWAAYDAPRAREAHRLWPAVDEIVATVGNEPVALSGDLKTCRSMLILGFDRFLPWRDGPRVEFTDVRQTPWVIAKSNRTFAGYSVAGDYGPIKLWRHNPPPADISLFHARPTHGAPPGP